MPDGLPGGDLPISSWGDRGRLVIHHRADDGVCRAGQRILNGQDASKQIAVADDDVTGTVKVAAGEPGPNVGQ